MPAENHPPAVPDPVRASADAAPDAARGSVDAEPGVELPGLQLSVRDLALLQFGMNRMRDAAYLFDASGHILYVNDEACRTLGHPREKLLTLSVLDIDPTCSPDHWAVHWEQLQREGTAMVETWYRSSDGRTFPVEIAANHFIYLGVAYELALARDISERREAEARVERLTALNKALSEISQAIVRMEQQAELFPLVCRCAVEFGGMSLAWVGQLDTASGEIHPVAKHGNHLDYLDGIRVTIAPDDPCGRGPAGTAMRESRWVVVDDYEQDPSTQPWEERRRSTGWRSGAAFPILRGGAPFAVLAVYHAQRAAFDTAAVALLDELCKDISFALDNFDREMQRKAAQETIWHHANFDTLTGLPNRHRFQDRLTQEIHRSARTGQALALLFLDLDHFKEVNDTLGHAVGDALLVEAARRLTGCVRASDTVARFGGDEFALILAGVGEPESVDRVCEAVLRVLSEPFQLGGERAYVSASLGVTLCPDDARDPDALLRNADQAMYAAKSAGRNRYSYFTPWMQAEALRRVRLTNELRGALAAGQLSLVFQPILALCDRALVGAEALLRWNHPALGRVRPAEFIPIAESTGLILPIGDWVFREVLQLARQWRERYARPLLITVNVSPLQVQETGGKRSAWHLQAANAGLPAGSIAIEITEGVLLHASEQARLRLTEERQYGIGVALDDFGTGYSALSYLREFAIDAIKIDKSFVSSLAPGSGDLALCEAMIAMAHKLGIRAIAEGIETEGQCQLLAAAGCDHGQGFLFSAGLPPEEFEARFLAGSGGATARAG